MNRLKPICLFATSLAGLTITPAALADSITVTALNAGVQNTTSTSYVENFDSASLTNGTYTTTFNNSGITGTYSGSGLLLLSQNVYGGANATGQYIAAAGSSSYTLSLNQGVNYFGLWDSALDGANLIQFYNGSTLLYSFTATSFINLVGACPSSSGYCGNPNSTYVNSSYDDSGEQFAYLNFYDSTGTFNKIVFTETNSSGQFESDNHAVANLTTAPGGTVVSPVPEPSSLALMGTGLIGVCGLIRRHYKRR